MNRKCRESEFRTLIHNNRGQACDSAILSNATESNGATTNWSQTNAYDRYGNRQIDYGGGSYNLTLSSTTNCIITAGFTYESAGNLTIDTIHTYRFDAESRIKTVDANSAYGYDRRPARGQAGWREQEVCLWHWLTTDRRV
jgi:hypothetical protein